jgi:hypothetical protein
MASALLASRRSGNPSLFLIASGRAIILNFRQCDYGTELAYTCTWSTVDVDLAQIQGVDLFMNYWRSPWIAHTIVSFDLGHGQHVAFSTETRQQVGLTYSALCGFLRHCRCVLRPLWIGKNQPSRLRTTGRAHSSDLMIKAKSGGANCPAATRFSYASKWRTVSADYHRRLVACHHRRRPAFRRPHGWVVYRHYSVVCHHPRD